MNIYEGHKHLLSDIIGIESLVLSGGGTIGSTPGSGYANVEFLAESLLNGYATTSARSDHRHNNIFSYPPTSANISLSNTDGIYSILLKSVLSNLTLDRTNTINVDADKFTLFKPLFDDSIQFDLSLLTGGGKKTYQFPNTSGVVVVSSVASDGSVLPSIGTQPPNIPRIIVSSCVSAFDEQSKTSNIGIAIGNPLDSVMPMNTVGFTVYYRQSGTMNDEFTFFSYQITAAQSPNTLIDIFTITNLVPGSDYEVYVTARNALGIESLKPQPIILTAAKSTIKPALPLNFILQYIGAGYVRASWSQNIENDLSGYELYASTSYPCTIGDNAVLKYSGTNENCTIYFDPSTPLYYIKLLALNKSGLGSTAQEAELLLPTSPSEPIVSNINLSSGAISGSIYIDVSFDDASPSSGNFTYVYKLIRKNYPDSEKTIFGSITPNIRFSNLLGNTYYTISVASISNLNIQSGWVSLGEVVTEVDVTPPEIPVGLSFKALYSSVIIEWNSNTEIDFDHYELYLDTVSDFTPSDLNKKLSGKETTTLVDIGRGTSTWYAKLCAVDTSGNKSSYATNSFSFDELPAPPTDDGEQITSACITASAVIDETGNLSSILKFSFSDIARTNFGYYEYRIFTVGHPESAQFFTSPSSYYEFFVLPNVQYNINVRVYTNKLNISNWADVNGFVKTSIKNLTPPNAPVMTGIALGFNSLTPKWTYPSNRDIAKIKVFRNTSDNSASADLIAYSGSNTYTDIGLKTGDTYFYWTKATNTSDVDSVFSNVVSGSSIQLLPTELDSTARVDFIVKDIILQFESQSTTLDWFAGPTGGIIFEGTLYTITASGSIANANNSYIIATLNTDNTTTLSRADFGSALPQLENNQIIIALTSTTAIADTGNYACYVRQSNSMAIEGAIIRDATITVAKIKELSTEIINTVGLNATSIMIGGSGNTTNSLADIANKAMVSTRNVFKGTWSATAGEYVVGDEVMYENSTWGCILDHTAELAKAPPDVLVSETNTWWSLRSRAAAGGATGPAGLAALTITLSNTSQNIPTDCDGLNGIYDSTGTDIYVSEGTIDLDYDGIGNTNGTWMVNITAVNISAGTLIDSGLPVRIGNASNITADTAYLSFAISGRRIGGETFVAEKKQTFVRIKEPVQYDVKVLSTNGDIFRVGQSRSTDLVALVTKNGVDVTDILPASWFRWRRVSYIYQPAADDAWNNNFVNGGYKRVTITIDSIDTIATFFCDIVQP